MLAASLNAQTTVNPTTNTVLFSGSANQDPQDHNTNPLAGIIMQGTAISDITGLPVRHLWVADTAASICRMDPEIDAAGPWHMTNESCYFFVNSGGAAIPVGGQFAYDPARKFLYFADNNGASQGVIRIGFDPSADSGHGALDPSTVFTLGGGAVGRKATFLGGIGCPLPTTGTQPNGAALSPLGDLYVGFLDSGDIVRFNSPGTATDDGFENCSQFVQKVATGPDGATTVGLVWIGHDLWSADGTSPFIIPNADTSCLVPPFDVCTTANGTVTPTLAQIAAPAVVEGDQRYPATNGNNLYFGVASQIAWVGNVAGGVAGQTLTLTYINDPNPDPPLAAISGLGVDSTDPANIVVYSAEDPAAAVVPPLLGQARWWQTTQTSAGPDVPGTPQHVVAVAGNAQIALSWSPQQAAQPVTSYTVRNSFISSGSPLADITVNPASGSAFPPTSIVIPGLTNGISYAFEVAANNATGSSPFSTQSNTVTPPGIGAPSAPTGATARAGDTEAIVTWTVSASNGGSSITSYTVSIIAAGVPTGITVTVPPPAFGSNTDSTLIGGLTNGTSYTFTVHATNIAGNSAESAPSAAIIPSAANLPTVSIAMSGPLSVQATPAQLTYTATVTNTSSFPVTNITVSDTLGTVPAGISLITRDATGVVTVSTSTTTQFAFHQTVTITGVSDPSFNGTFLITNTPTSSTFTYSQAGPVASSGGGSATLQPTANIMNVQTGQATCTAGGSGVSTFSCNIGNMAPGAVVRINVITQMQNQTITHSATVSGTDDAGTALVPKTASVTTTAPTGAGGGTTTDLQLSGSAQNGGPTVTGTLPTGAPDSYNWQIRNATSTPATNVVFTQTLPAALVFNSVTTDLPVDLGTCTGPAPGTAGGTVTCNSANLGGSRKNGAKPVQQFKVTVNVHVVQTGVISSIGTVSFTGNDTNTNNNTVIVTINAK
ncbi:MAG TPA: fibronectin type III domain-containing protein [Candidatus Angelobacter sp.]|nr:fibronectin type III domain-containing protein [Candidatus Angelobacter sp.]